MSMIYVCIVRVCPRMCLRMFTFANAQFSYLNTNSFFLPDACVCIIHIFLHHYSTVKAYFFLSGHANIQTYTEHIHTRI